MRRNVLLVIITLLLSGCVYPGAPVHNVYCKHVIRKLHGGSHRHEMGARVTSIKKATLYQEAQAYKCDSNRYQ